MTISGHPEKCRCGEPGCTETTNLGVNHVAPESINLEPDMARRRERSHRLFSLQPLHIGRRMVQRGGAGRNFQLSRTSAARSPRLLFTPTHDAMNMTGISKSRQPGRMD